MWVGFSGVRWPLWATSLCFMFLTLLFTVVVYFDYPQTFAGVHFPACPTFVIFIGSVAYGVCPLLTSE